ncbi:hypothetical protein Hypma_016370 [Hypsizygus marmoreus]|uniref:Uncharacterized protein n=1 Tax=Hypsizygus marmoreus TaxID=39966 RepID=A0A369J137_HYPMA|nr:hypothetical protein Hypma_016370 [Hypsizygus marmoreus]
MPPAIKSSSMSTSRRAAFSVRSAAATKPSATAPKRSTVKRSAPNKIPAVASGSGAATRRASKRRELEEFAKTFFKYSQIYEDMAVTLRDHPDELQGAHERQSKIVLEDRGRGPQTLEQIHSRLAILAARCDIIPQSIDDRLAVCFASMEYAQILLDAIVSHPSRPFSDRLEFMRMVTQMTRKSLNLPPAPAELPRLAKFIPDDPIIRRVSAKDLKQWRSHPKELLRKAFISHDAIRRVFLISDYCVKEVAGHCYEVRFEDCGPDVFTFSLADVLGMVAEAEFVTNA